MGRRWEVERLRWQMAIWPLPLSGHLLVIKVLSMDATEHRNLDSRFAFYSDLGKSLGVSN